MAVSDLSTRARGRVPSLTRDRVVFGVSFESVQTLATLLGMPVAPANGLVGIYAFDCQGLPASGVTFTMSSPGTRYYFVAGLPTLASASGTDPEGMGGFFNAAPGLTQLEVNAPSGKSIAGTRSVIVRGGWGSALIVRPPRSRMRTLQ